MRRPRKNVHEFFAGNASSPTPVEQCRIPTRRCPRSTLSRDQAHINLGTTRATCEQAIERRMSPTQLALLFLASPLLAQVANEPMPNESVRQYFFKDKYVLGLAAISTAAQVADGVTTIGYEHRGDVEGDPVAQVFLGRNPSWARMVPIGAAQIVGTAFLAHRMRISHNRFAHAIWWLPQSLSITVATGSAIHNHYLK